MNQNNPIIYKKKVHYNRLFVGIVKMLSPLIMRIYGFRINKINGSIPSDVPCLIACHHEEIVDQFVIVISVKKKFFWVADTTKNKPLVDSTIRKFFMQKLGVVPIDKRNPKRNAHLFDYLLFLLSKGEAVVFFPEAYTKKHRNNLKFGKFKNGVIRLALEYEKQFGIKIPIYPMGLKYNKHKKVDVNIGEVFYANKIEDMNELSDIIRRLSKWRK